MQRQIEDRLVLIEQQTKAAGLADLANQIQLLQGDIARLRGQIEVITYELEQAQKRQRDLYVDLDSRLRKIETARPRPRRAPPVPPPTNPAAPTSAARRRRPPVRRRQRRLPAAARSRRYGAAGAQSGRRDRRRAARYDAALDLFKRGDYQGAIGGFGSFVRRIPAVRSRRRRSTGSATRSTRVATIARRS